MIRTTLTLALTGLLLTSTGALDAQEHDPIEGLPWTVEDPTVLMDSHTIARGPVGAAFAVPPDLSPALPDKPPVAVLDTRHANAPRPEPGHPEATRSWLYWRARHLADKGEHAKAGDLFALLAPHAPGVGAHLHLDAAEAFSQAGAPERARIHLDKALELGLSTPRVARARVRISMGLKDWPSALSAFGEVLGDGVHVGDEACSLGLTLLTSGLDPQAVSLAITNKTSVAAALRRLPIVCANKPEADAIAKAHRGLSSGLTPLASRALRPAPEDMLVRARLHLQLAENDDARKVLASLLESSSLSDALACEVPFQMARTLRAMKRRGETRAFYEKAMSACTQAVAAKSSALRVLRTRAYYWTGRRAMREKDFESARAAFEVIAAEVPKVRHADDALYYLHQIAVAQGRRKDARVLLERLVRDYPIGDMTRQVVWEPIFEDLKADRWAKAHQKLLEAIKMPPDPTYYSQGRFWYYLGLSQHNLNQKTQAQQTWQQCFSKNPSVFYGHMCAQSLMKHTRGGRAWLKAHARPTQALPVPFEIRDDALRGFILLGDFTRAGALAMQTADDDPSAHNLWLAAYLKHLAGEHPVSHNIARRRVPGWPERYGHPTPETRLLWEIAFPDPYRRLQDHWATDRKVDPFIVRAITREESGFEPTLVSWAGAVGLMQMILPTARGHKKGVTETITQAILMKPEINIPIATRFLSRLYDMLGDAPILLACGYNAGPGAPKKWLKERGGWNLGLFAESIPYSEARNYSRRVTGSHGIYQWLYTTEPLKPWPLTAVKGP